ncbi:hypothetical protein D3C73_1126720 [compost metagenome]
MRADEQALTPVVGVATGFHVDRYFTDVEVTPKERIEDFTRRTVHVAVHFTAVLVVVVAGRIARDVAVDFVVIVGLVVPAGCTETGAPLVEIGKIEFT